jgi:protein gp37
MLRLAPPEWAAGWPSNVWAGTTVEDQRRADERIPEFLRVPAAVRFLSMEPLLGPVDLHRFMRVVLPGDGSPVQRIVLPSSVVVNGEHSYGVDWVIVGGESGPGARPFDLAWARAIVDECRRAAVPVFVKQIGAAASDPVNGIAGARLKVHPDAAELVSLRLKDPKGGDWSEWPEDLRVREWPAGAAR